MGTLLALAAVLVIMLLILRGSPELARLEVRDGKLAFVSGRMPSRLLEDFDDVLSGKNIARAVVRVVLDSGRPRVVATGLGEDELQRLRNVAGAYTTSQFRMGREARR